MNKLKPMIWIVLVVFLNISASPTPGKTSPSPTEPQAPAMKPQPSDTVETLEEKFWLESELQLADTSNLYAILDLRSKKIQLKIKGVVLREWGIEIAHFWGDPIPMKPLALKRKSSLFAPKRGNIKPGEAAAKDYKPDVLEVGDMPSSYVFYFEEGIRMYVRPQSGGFFAGFFKMARSLEWLMVPPFFTLWYSRAGEPFTAVDILMKDRNETRSLYWTLTESTPCFIFPPENLSRPPQPAPSTPLQPVTPKKRKSTGLKPNPEPKPENKENPPTSN